MSGAREPRLRVLAPAASHEEAAAIVAAIERFLRQHAAPPPAEPPQHEWRRRSLLDGVGAGDLETSPHPWLRRTGNP